MRAPLLKSVEGGPRSVILQDLRDPHFDPNWHFHSHYQLFTVYEGTGTRLIGDTVQPFGPGDTVFLGPDIPHLWRSDPPYFDASSGLATHGIVLYFQEDFLGREIFTREEMHPVFQLLRSASRGFVLTGALRERVQEEMKQLTGATGFQKVVRLLTLLDDLAHSHEKYPITSYGYQNTHKISETERMQRVHNYLLQHFKEEIRLKEVAAHAGMSEAAFCRYFKTRTRKTLTDFVSELRIGHACKLLQHDNWSISQIAFESGFDTLSNFNRYFKKITGMTPRDYKKDCSLPIR